MNAIGVLKKEHEAILQRFLRMRRGEDSDALREREGLFRQIKELLEVHMLVEEKVFFRACLEREELRGRVRECLEIHHLIQHLLSEVSRYELESEEWMAGYGALRDLVEEHFEEEERLLFPEAEPVLGAESLTQMMEEMALERMKSTLSPKESWKLIMHPQ